MFRLIRGLFRLWRLEATLAVVVALVLPLSTREAKALSSGLPSHFAFGVSAGQGDTWMPQTGIGWDYRMQYLAGGVNTGQGWETWNSNGTFALNYAQESAQHGYIPLFPYYELLQSSGSTPSRLASFHPAGARCTRGITRPR